MADAAPRPLLSPTELRVLRLLSRGLTEAEVAARLNYSYTHARRLAASASATLGARNRTHAVYLATRAGLI